MTYTTFETTTESRVEIQPRKLTAYFLLLGWLVLGIASVAGIVFGCIMPGEILARVVIVFAGILLLFAGLTESVRILRVLSLDGPIIECDAKTFLDRRISREPIPWSAIQWRAVYAKNGSIQLDVETQYEHLMFSTLRDRLSGALCKVFGFPRYSVGPFCTGHSTRELAKLFSQFKPELKRGRMAFHRTPAGQP